MVKSTSSVAKSRFKGRMAWETQIDLEFIFVLFYCFLFVCLFCSYLSIDLI